jgi:hypothetical protein
MSALLQSSRVTPDSRRGLHPDTQLCLVMVSAGLAALATMSPAARAAIVATLDDAVSTGHFPMGEHADAIMRLRDHVNVEGDPEAAKLRRLQEALISSALRAEADAQQHGVEDAPVATFG